MKTTEDIQLDAVKEILETLAIYHPEIPSSGVTRDTKFSDYGYNMSKVESDVSVIELVMWLEDKLDMEISDEDAIKISSVGDVFDLKVSRTTSDV